MSVLGKAASTVLLLPKGTLTGEGVCYGAD